MYILNSALKRLKSSYYNNIYSNWNVGNFLSTCTSVKIISGMGKAIGDIPLLATSPEFLKRLKKQT